MRLSQATDDLLLKPVTDVVKYLNKCCKSQLEKARAYFRWLTTRDLNQLPAAAANKTGGGDESAADGVIHALREIKDKESYNLYSELYVTMCRCVRRHSFCVSDCLFYNYKAKSKP